MSNKHPFVSVIIPTYHDWERLKLCVTALKGQTYRNDRLEVIIVNNDPDDAPPNLDLPENFTLLSESKPGSYAARNAGTQIAKGEILAFTDSDCIPEPDWLERAVAEIAENDADVLSGGIELFSEDTGTWLAWKYECVVAFKQHHRSGVRGVTANLIVRRSCFDVVGLFDESAYSGGDSLWTRSAAAKGLRIKQSQVKVHHPARRNMQEILVRNRRVAGARATRALEAHSFIRLLIVLLLPPIPSVKTWVNSGAAIGLVAVLFFVRWFVKWNMAVETIRILFNAKARRQ